MTRYILTRLIESAIAVLGLVTIVFLVARVLGDPASLLLPHNASAADLDAFRQELGLDRPLLEQYLVFLGQAVQGNFGTSFVHDQPALTIVLERMPATILLATSSIVTGLLIGLGAGLAAALWRNSIIEVAVLAFALLGQATPAFWLAIMLILFFAVDLGWLPTGGYGSWSTLVLPTMVMAIFVSANVSRLFRSSLLDVMAEDYMRTAAAKGLAPRTILTWHLMRNALLPVVTMTGLLAGEMLGGSVVTETIFSWPGVGRLIVQAIENRDFPVIQAGVAVVSTLFLLVNLVVDVLHGVLDPRVRARR